MKGVHSRTLAQLAAALCVTSVSSSVTAQIPDHPIITEVFNNPAGLNDGPVGRDPSNLHQEFLEIYLPTTADLAPGLNKDAIILTVYKVEGDLTSSGYTLVNYRIDLPTFDLDLANGLTTGAVARPSSGVVVLGWVDYVNSDAGNCLGGVDIGMPCDARDPTACS